MCPVQSVRTTVFKDILLGSTAATPPNKDPRQQSTPQAANSPPNLGAKIPQGWVIGYLLNVFNYNKKNYFSHGSSIWAYTTQVAGLFYISVS